jgi:hypothetical protein
VSGAHLRWPTERFYWCLLEAPHWKRPGPLPPGLRALLEDDVPVPVDSLHAVGTPLDGRVLACAVESATLASLPADAASLTPEAIPPFAPAIDPASLDLLVGAFEPRPLRRARLRRHLAWAGAVLAGSALVSIGLLRRAEMWDRAGASARAAARAMLDPTLPVSSADGLAFELARTRRLAESAARIKPAEDAAESLESLLRAWPSSVSSKPLSLALSESSTTISVAIEGDATPFLKAMKPPPGWSMDEPRVNAAESVTRLTLQLRPARRAFP